MAGANEVFLKQAGTGAAWMGPQSSFDPVLFAREAAFTKIGAEQGKKDEENKAKAAFLKGLKINPEQVLANDAMEGQQLELDALNEEIMSLMDPNIGWDPRSQQKAEYGVSQFAQNEKLRKAQEQEFLKFREMQKDGTLLADDMQKNGEIWYAPEKHFGDPEFQPYEQEYNDLLENVTNSDPKYKNRPILANYKARQLFRDNHRELLSPIKKPQSIPELWNKVKDIAVNNIKQVKGNDYNVKTDEYSSWDNDIEITTNQGDKKIVPSTKSNAINIYKNDADVQYAANYYYQKAPQSEKDNYKNSQDPVMDYYLDQVKGFSGDVTTSNVTNTKGGSNYNWNGYKIKTNLKMDPFEKRQFTSRKDKNTGGLTSTRGIEVKTSGGQELTLDNINAPVYYLADQSTQKAVPTGSKNMSMKGATTFKAPTFNTDYTITDLQAELEKIPVTGGTAWDHFRNKFGERYAGAESGNLNGIIVTDEEVAFFENLGRGDLLKDRKFTYGTLSYDEPDDTDPNKFNKVYFNGAIIPLEYTKGSINTAIGNDADIELAVDGAWPDNEYRTVKPQTQTNTGGSNTGGFNPKKTKTYTPNTTTTTTSKNTSSNPYEGVFKLATDDEKVDFITKINQNAEVIFQQDGSINIYDSQTGKTTKIKP